MKKAFTLAEVLITLMIIGIVAALTIPSVISNYQQQEYKTGLKKAVSVLNEAIQMNISQDGETPYENQDLFKYLQRHMNVIKQDWIGTCYNIQENWRTGHVESMTKANCSEVGEYSSGRHSNQVFYTADGMRFEFPNYKGHYFYLHETGTIIGEEKAVHFSCPYGTGDCVSRVVRGACGSYGLNSNPNNTIFPPCVLLVDVNGDKKPNPKTPVGSDHYTDELYTYPSPSDKKLSDIFSIMITDEKAIPFGVVAQRAMYSSK